MKKLIALCLCAALLTLPAAAFSYQVVDTDKVFSDELKREEAVSDWAWTEVQAAREAGLVVPSCETYMTYTITREQFAELAVNMMEVMTGEEVTPADEGAFTDCDNVEVRKAYAAGIVQGVGDGRFDPDGQLTREQLATMLFRAWLRTDDAFVPRLDLSDYEDADQVASWATESVGALANLGVMKGTSDTTLSPQDLCSIEQAILLVYRLYSY